MKINFTIILTLLSLLFSSDPVQAQAKAHPRNTLIVYHPIAHHPEIFFAMKEIVFQVAGITDEKSAIRFSESLKKNEDIESATVQTMEGENPRIVLVLKTEKNKEWFVNMFRKNNITTVSVNGQDPRPLDKL